jgi:hypothetical protein
MRDVEEVAAEVAEAEAAEHYVTPSWCVTDLLEFGPPELRESLGGTWLDPCVGTGAIPRAVDAYATSAQTSRPCWIVGDLRQSAVDMADARMSGDRSCTRWDWLKWQYQRTRAPRADVAIFNSPFTLTAQFVERTWEACPRAHVASLQRQSFRGSTARANWISQHQPRIYTFGAHRSRPSFRPDGKTDGAEYEWHVWLASERNCREIPGGHVLQPCPEDPPIQGVLCL